MDYIRTQLNMGCLPFEFENPCNQVEDVLTCICDVVVSNSHVQMSKPIGQAIRAKHFRIFIVGGRVILPTLLG